MSFAIVELAANSTVDAHDHPNEQIGIVLRGSMTFTVGDESRVLTAVFLWVILAVTDARNEVNVALGPLAIGLSLAMIHFVAIPLTGTSVNPARSIGVGVFAGTDAIVQLWLFVLAPLLGAVLAVVVYRSITLPAPELPTRLAEQALPSEQVERQPLSVREAEQALSRDQRERRP